MMILVALLGIFDKGWALYNIEESLDQQDEIMGQLLGTPPMTPQERERQKTMTLTIAIVGIVGACFGLIGGFCMVAVMGRKLAIASSIVAIIPGLHGCCILSTIVGVYALVMLLNKDVVLAFNSRGHAPRDYRQDDYDDRDR
jgi:hypothetical protein